MMEREPLDKNEHRIFDIRQRIRKLWVQVKHLHGSPHYVALGLAIGVFVAATPTVPFQTAIAWEHPQFLTEIEGIEGMAWLNLL